MIQLLIIYYVIFASVNIDKILVAVVAFGLNSAAYVAEVIRSGINSVDKGQFEAGRSLGLTYKQTMLSIILPQAFKIFFLHSAMSVSAFSRKQLSVVISDLQTSQRLAILSEVRPSRHSYHLSLLHLSTS